MLKKILASVLIGGALLVAAPVATDLSMGTSVAEAGHTKTHDGSWYIEIDDSSVAMVGNNHAHVGIRVKNLIPGKRNFEPYAIVDVMWGKGFVCTYLNGGSVSSDIGLAIANYMSENY